MRKKTIFWKLLVVIGAILTMAQPLSAQVPITADEILDQMEQESDRLLHDGLIAKIRLENHYSDGTTSYYLIGMLAKQGKTLMCFLEPQEVAGTLFLSLEATETEEARMWLYLPVLGLPKELVSEEERGGNFAGSALSYEEVGEEDVRKDYQASLVGEETLQISGQPRRVFALELLAKPGADVTTTHVVIWVGAEASILLKSEGYNDLGNLVATMEVLALDEFEGHLVPVQTTAHDFEEGVTTVLTVLERRRPAEEIPDQVFSPHELASFDPIAWGF